VPIPESPFLKHQAPAAIHFRSLTALPVDGRNRGKDNVLWEREQMKKGLINPETKIKSKGGSLCPQEN